MSNSAKLCERHPPSPLPTSPSRPEPRRRRVRRHRSCRPANSDSLSSTITRADIMRDQEADCPLCLCVMEPHDCSHPLQCPSSHCAFNCCMDCLEQMIKSAEDRVEASDGNAFRVLLQCPNCRGNLGPSIRDTILLRKVDKYSQEAFKQHRTADGIEIVDEQLPASELRFKYALKRDEHFATAIEGARRREDAFFGRNNIGEKASETDSLEEILGGVGSSIGSSFSSVWSFDDEEGVEADLLNGPHNSFIFHHHSMDSRDDSSVDERDEERDVKADPTLLLGLDAFMSPHEQQFVTAHMISGDTGRLAVAMEMMYYISALSRRGAKPSQKRRQSDGPSGSMLENIKEVIREGNEARRLEEEGKAGKAVGAVASRLNTPRSVGAHETRMHQKRIADKEMREQINYMKLHPLPLRMPKYAEVRAMKEDYFNLTFVDDMWDGTVLDAFSKIVVNTSLLGSVNVTRQRAESLGIRRIIDAGATRKKSDGDGYIDIVRPRVVVASINWEVGQQGVATGDVVTHLNGERFKGTANELVALMTSRYEGEIITLVFNADDAVAEALRRRSMILD